jgi:hypothetical protein
MMIIILRFMGGIRLFCGDLQSGWNGGLGGRNLGDGHGKSMVSYSGLKRELVIRIKPLSKESWVIDMHGKSRAVGYVCVALAQELNEQHFLQSDSRCPRVSPTTT